MGDYLATTIVGEADPTGVKAPEAAVVVRHATELTLPLEILQRLPDDLAVEFAAIEAAWGDIPRDDERGAERHEDQPPRGQRATHWR